VPLALLVGRRGPWRPKVRDSVFLPGERKPHDNREPGSRFKTQEGINRYPPGGGISFPGFCISVFGYRFRSAPLAFRQGGTEEAELPRRAKGKKGPVIDPKGEFWDFFFFRVDVD